MSREIASRAGTFHMQKEPKFHPRENIVPLKTTESGSGSLQALLGKAQTRSLVCQKGWVSAWPGQSVFGLGAESAKMFWFTAGLSFLFPFHSFSFRLKCQAWVWFGELGWIGTIESPVSFADDLCIEKRKKRKKNLFSPSLHHSPHSTSLFIVLVEAISGGLIDCQNDLYFIAQLGLLGQKMSLEAGAQGCWQACSLQKEIRPVLLILCGPMSYSTCV